MSLLPFNLLKDLPMEIVDSIVRKCDQKTLTNLMFTGFRTKNGKLISDIVQRFLLGFKQNELSSSTTLAYLRGHFRSIESVNYMGPTTSRSLYKLLDDNFFNSIPPIIAQISLCSRIKILSLLSRCPITNELVNVVFPDLPNTIHSFTTNIQSVFEAYINRMPKSLTTLKVSLFFSIIFEQALFFPENLTSLNLINVRFEKECYSSIPSELEVLKTNDDKFSDLTIGRLKNLKQLTLGINRMSNRGIQQLPSTLLSLSIYPNNRINQDEMIASLPQKITELTLTECLNISDEAWMNLPTTLKKLHFTAHCKGPTAITIERLGLLTDLFLDRAILRNNFFSIKWPTNLTNLALQNDCISNGQQSYYQLT